MKLSKEVLDALKKAVINNAPVADLEIVGLPTRVINKLEEFGIFQLEELLSLTTEEVKAKAIIEIAPGIYKY